MSEEINHSLSIDILQISLFPFNHILPSYERDIKLDCNKFQSFHIIETFYLLFQSEASGL